MRRAALASLILSACSPSASPSAQSPKLNTQVHVSLPSNGGARVAIPIASARSTVVDFWAPSCIPCRRSLPTLVDKRAALEAKGAALVLVAVLGDSESTEDAEKALSSWGVQSPFVIDRVLTGGVGAAQEELGVRSLPATLIIDSAGVLRWIAPDAATADEVVRAVP